MLFSFFRDSFLMFSFVMFLGGSMARAGSVESLGLTELDLKVRRARFR